MNGLHLNFYNFDCIFYNFFRKRKFWFSLVLGERILSLIDIFINIYYNTTSFVLETFAQRMVTH
jgi:hypothetical protein